MAAATNLMALPPDPASCRQGEAAESASDASALVEPPPDNDSEGVIQRHVRSVWRFLRLLGCPPDDADELTQDTFVIALQKGTGDRNEREVAAFLRTTARHLFLRTLQRDRRRAELLAERADLLFEEDTASNGIEAGEVRVAALRICLDELADRPRRIIDLFYGEQRSRLAIAASLGLQENGVKTALQRIRATLRDCLTRRMS